MYNDGNLTITYDWFDENGNYDDNFNILTQYFETTTYYEEGEPVDFDSKVITEEEYDSFSSEASNGNTRITIGNCTNLSSGMYNDCWETNAKRITLAVKDNYPSNVKIAVINTWKTIPSVKSYVIAFKILTKKTSFLKKGNKTLDLCQVFRHIFLKDVIDRI